jgi:hypothetical protein
LEYMKLKVFNLIALTNFEMELTEFYVISVWCDIFVEQENHRINGNKRLKVFENKRKLKMEWQ